MKTPPVVFVPGFMQRGEAWAPVARRVAERYPTRCLDFETHTLVDRLGDLHEATPPGSVVVGYSLGGRLALLSAVLDAERRLAAVVTVGAGAGIENARDRRERRAADEALAARIEAQPIEQTVTEWEAQPIFAGQPPELVEAQRAGRLAHRPEDLAALLRSAGQGAMDPFWDSVASLPIPLLAMAGERDTRYVEAAERLATVAPRGRVAIVPDAGHAAHLEKPDHVAERVLEFLDARA